jgi:hypothetical protein
LRPPATCAASAPLSDEEDVSWSPQKNAHSLISKSFSMVQSLSDRERAFRPDYNSGDCEKI